MEETDIAATLSKANRSMIEALYQHPLAHNPAWSDVIAMFERLGSVDEKSHHQIAFGLAVATSERWYE